MLDKNSLPDIDNVVLPDLSMGEHIPVACHYNPDTLLTKNSDLVQIIEISGFAENIKEGTAEELREAVRDAIHQNIPSYEYAVYIHTIRSRKNIMPSQGQLPFGIANDMNEEWRKKNNWDKQLTNTLYISVVRQGINASLGTQSSFANALYPSILKKNHVQFFEKASIELTMICNNIISRLSSFGARKMNLLRTSKGYLSEPLFFYYNIIHLSQKRTPLPVRDLSEYLSSCRMLMHFNSIDIKNDHDTEQRFAALFSVKEQASLSHDALDKLLQLGTQFIISQAIIFVPKEEALEKCTEINKVFKSSKAEHLSEISGANLMVSADTGKVSDYCKEQTTICVLTDTPEFFQKRLNEVVHTMHELGIVVVREDFFMPKLFWSQLPGNFKYLARFNYKCHKNIGEFTCIHSLKSGNYKGSKWGPPVTLIRQQDGSIYYFNFHDKTGNGHTLIVGPTGTGKTALQRFLLSQALRFSPRTILVDVEGKSQNFCKSIGGVYTDISEWEKPAFRINPFDLQIFENNLTYFQSWLLRAIFQRGEGVQPYEEFFNVLAQKVSEVPEKENRYATLEAIINASGDTSLIEGFKTFLGNPDIYNKLFTNGNDEVAFWDLDNTICINISSLKSEPLHFNAYVGILMQRLASSLDNKPTIIAMNKAYKLYDIRWFGDMMSIWLQKLQQKNAIAFFTSDKNMSARSGNRFTEDSIYYGTKIFLSDKLADKYFRKAYQLNDYELYKIKSYDASRRTFLLKHDGLSLIMSLDLSPFPEQLRILTT